MFFPLIQLRTLARLWHLTLLLLLLLLPSAHALIPHLNRALCCETALNASATDHANFRFNFHLWNSLVHANSTPPRLPDNDDWNALLDRQNSQTPPHEYLDFRCGAVYSYSGGSESLAAMSILVTLAWARKTPACMGFETVPLAAVDKWAGPVVGFLLPAVVFALSISRGCALTLDRVLRASGVLRFQSPQRMKPLLALLRTLLGPVAMLVAFLLLGLLEILRWATVIFTCAGPILSSALHEMRLDHLLLSQLSLRPSVPALATSTELRHRRLLLAILLSNVSGPDGEVSSSTVITVLHAPAPQARAHLRILLAAHTSFDVTVGAPIAFYTVAYAYALFDAYQKLGDLLTASTLTFGLWYSEFVLVAVISGCLLGCNNGAIIGNIVYQSPSSSSVIVGAPWNRGRCAQTWAVWADPQLKPMTALSTYFIAIVTTVLISLPCCLALLVSYRTPASGPGCRSTSIILYWSSQVLLIILHTLHSSFPHSPHTRTVVYLLVTPALIVSFASAVGGTILQLTGLFVNVYCLAGVHSFMDPDNPAWVLDLATDTLLVRRLARYRWRYTGVAGLGLLCAVCVATWWYQSGVKKRCGRAIADLQRGMPIRS